MNKAILIFFVFNGWFNFSYCQVTEFIDYPNYAVYDLEELSDKEIIMTFGPLNRNISTPYFEFLSRNLETGENDSFLKLDVLTDTKIVDLFLKSGNINIIGVKGNEEYIIFKYVYSYDLELISYEETESFTLPDPITYFRVKEINDVYYMTGALFIVGPAFAATYSDGILRYKLFDNNIISNDIQIYNDSIYILGDRLTVMDTLLENSRLIEQPCITFSQGHILFRDNKMFTTGTIAYFNGENTSFDLGICSYDATDYSLIAGVTVEGENTDIHIEKTAVFKNLQANENGDLWIGGTSSPQNELGPFAPAPSSLLVGKYDSDLNLLCHNELFFDRGAYMLSITLGSFSRNYIGGSLYNAEEEYTTPLLIQLDDECLLSTTKEALADQSGIILFPNPASEMINIENKDFLDIHEISLYQINGALVRQYTGDISTINIEGLATGIYTIKINTEQGVYVQRVMVTR